MTTNKTFLILLLAGISYTAYNATAVSENFAISTTIDHEITLGNFRAASADANVSKTGDLNMGTIYINPAYTGSEGAVWAYNSSGIVSYIVKGPVVSASNINVGTFSADIPNLSACSKGGTSCGGLSVWGNSNHDIINIFGGDDVSNWCYFYLQYSGSGNTFYVYPYSCNLKDVSKVTRGLHTGTLTISYNPE